MQLNTVPEFDMSDNQTGCCARFNPKGWDHQTFQFKDKPFVRATTKSIVHVPVNMGSVFNRVQENMETAGAFDPKDILVLSRDLSAWEAEHFFSVAKDVEGEEMVLFSGTYITRVFEGPYRKAKDWVHDIEVAAKAEGHEAKAVYFFYTTCPRCAKAYGENYIIGVAEI